MKRALKIALLQVIIVAISFLTASAQWAASYSDASTPSADEAGVCIQQTADGGTIIVGAIAYDVPGPPFPVPDLLVMKLDPDGEIEWQKTFGEHDYSDYGTFVQQTADGGYIIAGTTESYGAGASDAWLLKLTGEGVLEWAKTYGGTGVEEFHSVFQTEDGYYMVAGLTMTSGFGPKDGWVLKLDGSGNVIWQKTYGGMNQDMFFSIEPTIGGGSIVGGFTGSFTPYQYDHWLLKLDADGNVEWQEMHLLCGFPETIHALQTSDGGYIVADSFWTALYASECRLLKLDMAGDVEWQRTYGGSLNDAPYFIQQTTDGGYIVAGYTESFGAGGVDIWLLKLTSTGNVEWQKTYGGSEDDGRFDQRFSIREIPGEGYIMTGTTESFFGVGDEFDSWVLKLDTEGEIAAACPTAGLTIAPAEGFFVEDLPELPVPTGVTPVETSVLPSAVVPTITLPPIERTLICGRLCVTLLTTPSALKVTVDGVPHVAPYTFCGSVGDAFTVGAPSPQTGDPGTRYVFASWSDSGTQTHSVTSECTLTAAFTTEYKLTTEAVPPEGGTVTPAGESWHEVGTSVEVTAIPSGEWAFSEWSGDLTGDDNPDSLNMDGPKSVQAHFVEGNDPPDVELLSPSGGELCFGTYVIRWEASDPDDTDADLSITLYYSADGGSSWTLISSGEPNDGSYEWNTTGLANGSNYKVKAIVEDPEGATDEDIGNAFTINNALSSEETVVHGPNPVPEDGCVFWLNLPEDTASAALTIYDVDGVPLIVIPLGPTQTRYPPAGRWEPKDNRGRRLGNGLYLYRIKIVHLDGRITHSEVRRLLVQW